VFEDLVLHDLGLESVQLKYLTSSHTLTAAHAANWRVDELVLASFYPVEAIEDDSDLLEITIDPARHFAHVRRAVIELRCDPDYASEAHVRMVVAALFEPPQHREAVSS